MGETPLKSFLAPVGPKLSGPHEQSSDSPLKYLNRSEVLTEQDIPSLGVRTGGWVEVDVSAAVVVVVVAAPGGGGFSEHVSFWGNPS